MGKFPELNSSFKTGTTKKVALVLNGGLARGFFQIGVLSVLQNKFPVDIVVGTGIGAYFAAFYAADIPFIDVEKLALELKPEDFLSKERGSLFGLYNWKRIKDKFNLALGIDNRFENLTKKLLIPTTDIEEHHQIIFSQGRLNAPLEANTVFLGFNAPKKRAGKYLADGTILNPLPIDIARNNGARFIIAIDTISQHNRFFDEKDIDLPFLAKYGWRALPHLWILRKKKVVWLQMRALESAQTYAIDNLLKRLKGGFLIKLEDEYNLAEEVIIDDFDKIGELIKVGKKAGKKMLPEILVHI